MRKFTADILRCGFCRRRVARRDTLVIRKNGKEMRLCRDCQLKYFLEESANLPTGQKRKVRLFSKNISDNKDERSKV